MVLHRAGQIKATLNGPAVALGLLDQNKIAKAEFRLENASLQTMDRVNLRALYGLVDLKCKSSEEVASAPEFIQRTLELARATGGEPPLPERPDTLDIQELNSFSGNEQALNILKQRASLETDIKAWKQQRETIIRRIPSWTLLLGLSQQAATLDDLTQSVREVEAIKEQRSLLAKIDPVPPRLSAIGAALRTRLNDLYSKRAAGYASAQDELNGNAVWQRLDRDDATTIARKNRLTAQPDLPANTDHDLLAALIAQPLSTIEMEIAAIPGNVQSAIADAARLLEPKVKAVRIDRVTLRSIVEIEAWIGIQRAKLTEVVSAGNPALVE